MTALEDNPLVNWHDVARAGHGIPDHLVLKVLNLLLTTVDLHSLNRVSFVQGTSNAVRFDAPVDLCSPVCPVAIKLGRLDRR
jgi:hypothetical protein